MNFSEEELGRQEALKSLFGAEFGAPPARLFSAPGRAELIGNHTDHNLGKVLVSAVSCSILCAASPRGDGMIEILSDEFSPIRFNIYDLASREREKGKSIALVRGVLGYLSKRGYSFGGFSACTQSNVFRGAGVSSSAAFEVLIAEVVNRLYLNGALTPLEKALAAQYAENVYFGKPCGLLDQAGIAYGGLSRIDFGVREPEVTPVPPPQGYRIVMINTGGSHAKLTAHYADIRREMAEVAAFFGKTYLREIAYEDILENLARLRRQVSDRAILRALHFFEENVRVDRAAEALLRGDLYAFLEQVAKSGESSLSLLQNCFIPGDTFQPVVLALKMSERLVKDGAFRMMGGGFTGTVLAFCKEGTERAYGREMARVFGKENVYYTALREEGACEIKE